MNITENIQKLITLAADHPELPIIAMVDGEVVGDDSYSRWVGYFGSVELGEFVLYNDRFIDDREISKISFTITTTRNCARNSAMSRVSTSTSSKTDVTHMSSITKTRRTERNLKNTLTK